MALDFPQRCMRVVLGSMGDAIEVRLMGVATDRPKRKKGLSLRISVHRQAQRLGM